jgi:hypothetical protein
MPLPEALSMIRLQPKLPSENFFLTLDLSFSPRFRKTLSKN